MARLTGIDSAETLLGIVNVLLLFGLFIIFAQQWRRTKAQFSLGLMLFAGIFVLKELLGLLQLLGRATLFPRVELLITLGEAVGLGILLYIVAR